MTHNIPKHPRGLRVLLGSGNRAALMAERPACGPEDVLGCAQSGCGTVSASASTTYGAGSCSANLGTFSSTAGVLSFTPGTSTGCAGAFGAPGPLEAKTTVSANCGTGGALPSTVGRTTCDSAGLPRPAPDASQVFSPSATFTPSLADPCVPSRMFSFWAYGLVKEKRMENPLTPARARDFDDNRFTDVPLAKCNGWPGNACQLVEVSNADVRLDTKGNFSPVCLDGATKCKAEGTDPGWMYSYGKFCPAGPGKCATTPPWCDERTGSQGFSFANCMIWSGFRPTGAAATNDPCTSAAGAPTSFFYFADFLSGIPTLSTDTGVACGFPNDPINPTTLARGAMKSAFSAPQPGALSVSVNQKGQVAYTQKQTDSSGTSNTQLGTRSSLAEPLYWLEVPRQVHVCRHVDPDTCK
jgi:type IV pilus assembly protein PilY1